ncbi:methionyl-tRNA formyltransferase [Skermanella stibiiresistens]|nr:formyltransferase family protein [Skermanella stibiiresistens]
MGPRFAFIGCVELSHALLRRLLTSGVAVPVGVVTREASPFNADFRSLADLAMEADCPIHFADDGNSAAMADFLRDLSPDVICCVGWSRLLPKAVLDIPPKGVIGYHPAALPNNRGRHPLIWALALGLSETASTFFLMDEGADTGPILDQRPVIIHPDDTARTLYARVAETALVQIGDIMAGIGAGTTVAVPQDHGRATVWRKRGPRDGEIDWRMSAKAIFDLVRALSHPYPGAHCQAGGSPVKVWRAGIGPPAPANLEPGRVLDVSNRGILVKCWDGSVLLMEHEFNPLPEPGTCL